MRQVGFVEVAPYEREGLDAVAFPGFEVIRTPARLDETMLPQLSEVEILSPFIYSRLTEETLGRLPKLRLIATRSTGYDHIDLSACRRRGIAVANVPSYGENTVAEHAIALMMALARRLPRAIAQTRNLDFSWSALEGNDAQGKTFGVLGAGHIGMQALRMARGLGMRTLAFDVHPHPAAAAEVGFEYVSFEQLLEDSDVLSLHAALVPETRHLIDERAFARMKPGVILINTARGPIVDSQALCEALDSGKVAAAGLDVFEGEELIKDEVARLSTSLTPDQLAQLATCHALLRRDNVILTPHIAFFTVESVRRLLETSLENIRRFLDGQPQNLVQASGT